MGILIGVTLGKFCVPLSRAYKLKLWAISLKKKRTKGLNNPWGWGSQTGWLVSCFINSRICPFDIPVGKTMHGCHHVSIVFAVIKMASVCQLGHSEMSVGRRYMACGMLS